jgi:hypothetical protein
MCNNLNKSINVNFQFILDQNEHSNGNSQPCGNRKKTGNLNAAAHLPHEKREIKPHKKLLMLLRLMLRDKQHLKHSRMWGLLEYHRGANSLLLLSLMGS